MFLLLALIVGATGCTRSLEKSTESTVRLSVPQSISQSISAQAVTNADLGNLMINISGPGINQPIFFQWDNKDSNISPPPNFAISDVPQGDGRLVQVLAIYKDNSTNQEIFYYGDITAPIKADVVPLAITVFSFQGVTGEGQIGGRYMTDSTNGPTGVVRMYYQPPGKPRMLVHFSEIYGGWFNLFALKGQTFDYVLDNGELLFGAPTALDSTHINTLGDGRLKVNVPEMYVERDGGPREFRSAEEHIYGWFGPGATGKKICYDSSGGTIPNAYDALTAGNLVAWSSGYVTSGLPHDSLESLTNLCELTSLTRYAEFISLDHTTLAYHDGALNHRGPFKMLQDGSNKTSLLATFPASTLNLNWQYLPGVLTGGGYQGIDGADIFVRELPGGANGDIRENYRSGGGDGIDCLRLPLVQYPFTLVANAPAPLGTDVTLNIPAASLSANFQSAFSAGNTQSIVCPYRMTPNGKRYMREVAMHRNNGGGPPVNVQFISATSNVAENAGTHYVVVNLSNTSTNPVMVDYNASGGSANSGGVDYTLNSGTLTIPSGQTTATIAIAITDDNISEGDETVSISIGPATNASVGTISFHTVTVNDNEGLPTISFISPSSNPSDTIGSHPVVFQLSNPSSTPITVDVSINGSSTALISTDYTVTGTGTLITFAPNDTMKTVMLTLVDNTSSGETVIIDLSNKSANAIWGSFLTHTVSISD